MSLKSCFFTGILLAVVCLAKGQNAVGIGVVSPKKNVVLELVSPGNNQGLLVPRLTTAQPERGLIWAIKMLAQVRSISIVT